MGQRKMMKIWATFGRSESSGRWRLQSLSVLSAERARALAEREQVRSGSGPMDLIVRSYESIYDVPWVLESPDG